MRVIVARCDKTAVDLVLNPDRRAELQRPRPVKTIRLDRHIRQAEWAERLRGRSEQAW